MHRLMRVLSTWYGRFNYLQPSNGKAVGFRGYYFLKKIIPWASCFNTCCSATLHEPYISTGTSGSFPYSLQEPS